MADINKARDKEVKVEDLLRLKRAERPDDAFWDTFDRELHQRMLQTLVKKDPWYVQLLRGVSSRIAQTATVGAAAAFLAMIVVRPAFVASMDGVNGVNVADSMELEEVSDMSQFAKQIVPLADQAPVEVAMSELDLSLTPDYQIEEISAEVDARYTQEYAHDTFSVADYDRAAYVADTASFAGSGLATALVY
jgi:hypothetical protein